MKKEINFGIIILMGIVLLSFVGAGSYSSSNPNYGLFESYVGDSLEFNTDMCEAGQDFIIQIAPLGCTPLVVRSDLLEEQNVPVFCQLSAIQINPLIEVKAIDSISFTGDYPKEVSGIGFHPAQAALSSDSDLDNIGYVVIVLKKQKNASAMPDYVEGTLTARISYDIEDAYGIGKANFYLPALSDEDWEKKYKQYGFWEGKGYLRAESVYSDKAIISVYTGKGKVSSVSLEEGETSNEIYLPGFDCLAGLKLKLNSIENPDTRAKLRVGGDIIEVAKGEKFLDNKCQVRKIEKEGLSQNITIKCDEDENGFFNEKAFVLQISPQINLTDGESFEALDRTLDQQTQEYYENSIDDYHTVVESFPGETYPENSDTTLGEEALYREIELMSMLGQKEEMLELCDRFKVNYPNSNKNLDNCDDIYKISNSEISEAYVMINGKTKKISFDGIYEPSLDDYSVKITISNADEECSGDIILGKDDEHCLSEKALITLKDLEPDYAVFVYHGEGVDKYDLKISEGDYEIIGEKNYKIRVDEINLKEFASVSVIPNVNNAGTEANFSFKIGIEQRLIQLSPEKTKELIESLDEIIETWTSISEDLGTVIKGLKTACLAVSGWLTVKNFIENTGGKAIARQEVMKGEGGWYEICAEKVNKGEYISSDQCLIEESDNIDNDVEIVYSIIEEQNEQSEELQKDITTEKFLGESVVDDEEFMKIYPPVVQEYLEDNFRDTFEDVDGEGEAINMIKVESILTYEGWKENNYDKEQLRDIELYARILNDENSSPELKELASKRLYSELLDVQTTSESYVERSSISNSFGISPSKFAFVEIDENTQKISYDGLTYGDIKGKASFYLGVEDDTPIQFIQTSSGGIYILVLDDSSGTDKMPIKRMTSGSEQVLMVYDLQGNRISDSEIPKAIKNSYFEKYDRISYQNHFDSSYGENRVVVRYYETEPYKGLPAIVPFDLNEGWYAATKQTLSIYGGVEAYDESGRVSSVWLCNVGENGIEEFNIVGDDICQMINLASGQPYNQFSGLDEEEAIDRVEAAVDAIEQVANQYESGVSTVRIKTKYGTLNLPVGSPATDVSEIQCQDFMSPKDCQLMFNVCDPVICPSSRCDFGGTYPVQDVIQSGIIGSILLCLPNYREGIYIPVCLTGVKAGIDGFLSILTSYRDCLQTSLDTGEMVGVCDEIYSIYICEFLWKQVLPLAKITFSKVLEVALGQNVRGGGEYLGIESAWSNAESSVEYFTEYYAVNAFEAFKARSTEEVGTEICKVYVSGVYSDSGNIIDSLTEPDSPPQYYGYFEEIPFTSVTVPPVSQYKVFYHIYAGQDSGVYYKVYLKGGEEISFYQDTATSILVASGYIPVGEYTSETKDFTTTSGYSEMCIMINENVECGFKEVSTSFAVDYITDEYIQVQAEKTDIDSESECISGSDLGIIRVCATDNPGEGTDSSRWIEVGYCDDEKIKCWIDTESVEDALEFEVTAEDTLEDLAEAQIEALLEEGDYLSSEEFYNQITLIEEEEDPFEKIDMINDILDNVLYNDEKAYLHLLRGDAYKELALRVYADYLKNQVPDSEDTETEQEDSESEKSEEETEQESEQEIEQTSLNCQEEIGKEILNIAKQNKDKYIKINDEIVKEETGAESFECLVLQVAMQESQLQHCEKYEEGSCFECRGIWIFNKITKSEESVGVMQINIKQHDVAAKDFYTNIEYGIELLSRDYDKYKNGEFFSPTQTTYYGWKAALRAYNGWGYGGDNDYVENVINQKDKIANMFPECA